MDLLCPEKGTMVQWKGAKVSKLMFHSEKGAMLRVNFSTIVQITTSCLKNMLDFWPLQRKIVDVTSRMPWSTAELN